MPRAKAARVKPKPGEWSDGEVYESIRTIFLRTDAAKAGPIFRLRHVPDRAGRQVAIRVDEWLAIADSYAQSKRSAWTSTARYRSPRTIPLLVDQVLSDPSSPLFRLVGRAFFADSKATQLRALTALKKASSQGGNASRAFARKLRREIPKVRRQRGAWELFSSILGYRAERRLLWLYIVAELEQAGWLRDDSAAAMQSWLRSTVDEILLAMPWLSTLYGLNANRVIRGLDRAEQADAETAKRFRFKSANALQKFISSYRPSK